MISPDSFHSNGSKASSVLDALEGHQTDAEFHEMTQKNRCLAICKQKGFKHLEKLGVTLRDDVKWVTTGKFKDDLASEKFHKRRHALALQAKELREEGLSFMSISKKLNSNPDSIKRAFKAYKIKPDELKFAQSTAAMVKDGRTIGSVAQHAGVISSTLRRLWKKNGLEVKPTRQGPKRCYEVADIVELVNNKGINLAEAARKVGSCRSNVRRAIKSAGYSYDANIPRLIKNAK